MRTRDAALAAYGRLVERVNTLAAASATLPTAVTLNGALHAALTMHGPVSEHSHHPPACDHCKTPWPCLEITRIASALELDVQVQPPAQPPQPPEGARRLDADHTLAYSVAAEAFYAQVVGDALVQEITVGSRHDDGSGPWEFDVCEDQVGGTTILRLSMFGDGFAAFAAVPDLFEALHTDSPRSLADLRVILDRIGAWDATLRQPPN